METSERSANYKYLVAGALATIVLIVTFDYFMLKPLKDALTLYAPDEAAHAFIVVLQIFNPLILMLLWVEQTRVFRALIDNNIDTEEILEITGRTGNWVAAALPMFFARTLIGYYAFSLNSLLPPELRVSMGKLSNLYMILSLIYMMAGSIHRASCKAAFGLPKKKRSEPFWI